MTQQSRNVTANFQYKVNTQSVQLAVQANRVIAQSFQPVQAAANRAAIQYASAAQAAQSLNLSAAQMQQLGLQTQNVATQAASATSQLQKLSSASANASAVTTLGNLRNAAIALPGVGYQSPLVVGLRAAELAAAKTGASLLEVGVAGGIAGVALIAVVLAFDHFTEGIKDAKKALDAALVAQNKYYDALGSLTTQQVAAQVAELNRLQALLKQQRDATQAAKDNAFAQEQRLGGDALARIADAAGLTPAQQLQKTLDDLNKQIAENDHTLNRFTEGLRINAFAVNDAIDNAKRVLDLDKLTTAEREKRFQEDQRQIVVLTYLANMAGQGTDAFNALQVQIDAINKDVYYLQNTFSTFGDTMERLKQIQENAKTALEAVNEQWQIEAEALTRAADIRQRIAEADADAQQKSLDLALDNDQKVSDAQADAEEKRREIAADGAEKRQDIDRDDAERRAEILKRFNTDYGNAVAERDALAAFKAKQQRDDDLAKQDKAHQKQLEDLQKSLDKQLAAVQRSLDKQLRSIEQQYQRQQRSIDDAYNKQLRGLQQDLAEQNAVAQNARQQGLILQQNYNSLQQQYARAHQDTLLGITNTGMANVATNFRNWIANLSASIPHAGGSTGGGVGSVIVGGAFNAVPILPSLNGGLPTLITGGAPGRNSVPASRTRDNGTFMPTININGSNMTPAQAERIAVNALVKAARKAGFRG